MPKFEIPINGETFYMEVSKVRGEDKWEVLQRGIPVGTFHRVISSTGELVYKFISTEGVQLNFVANSPEDAARHLAKLHTEYVRVAEQIYSVKRQEPEIWPIPDLADWSDSVLDENLAIYKAEPPDDYLDYRINELTAEIERREAISRRAMLSPEGLPAESNADILSNVGEVGCPPLLIQFGEVGGLRLETVETASSVLAAIGNTLEKLGYSDLAEHTRKLWKAGIAPILERVEINGTIG